MGALADKGQQALLGEAGGASFEAGDVDVDLAKQLFVPGHPCFSWRHQD
jgi:hypothetical protein